MLDKYFKKEKPIQGLLGMGGGISSRIFGGGGAFEVRGGAFFNPGDGYFYHMFEGSGVHSLEVKGSGDVDMYILGAGGGSASPGIGPPGVPGGQKSGVGGAAGGSVEASGFGLSAGTYSIQLGGAGQSATDRTVPTPGGYNGGGSSGVARPNHSGQIPYDRGTGGGGGAFSRFYDPSTTYLAAGGGGGGGKSSIAYGGDDDTNNTYSTSTTSGSTGYTNPTTSPNGSNGGAGSGGGFNGSGGGGGDRPGGGGGYGGDSYAHPSWTSSTFYKGNSSSINSPEPSNRQSGPFINSAPPSRIWIPEEPSVAGRGTKTMNNEVPSSSKIHAGNGFAILRYLANPSVSSFTTSGLVSNLTPYIPGNGYEYYVMTEPGNVTITKSATIDVLAVGGGGGTATFTSYSPSNGNFEHYWRSGGGGGGVVRNTSVPVSSGSYPITVGSGGSGAAAGGDTTAFGVTAPGGSAGSPGPTAPGGPGGGNGTWTNGGNGTQVSGFHPFYVGLADGNINGAPGLPSSVPGNAYYGGGGSGYRPAPQGSYSPGLGGGGNIRSFNNQFSGIDGLGGGGSITAGSYPWMTPGPGVPVPSSGSSNGGDGVVIFRVQL